MRVKCDIYTSEEIVRQAGIVLEDDVEEEPAQVDLSEVDMDEEINKLLTGMNVSELEAQLKQAVEQEDYELAKLVRDELQNRKETDTE